MLSWNTGEVCGFSENKEALNGIDETGNSSITVLAHNREDTLDLEL